MFGFLTKPLGIIILIILIGIVILASLGEKSQQPEVIVADFGNITEEVNVTGKVVPAESVDLAFEKSGRVAWVAADVSDMVYAGQILVQLENADLKAQLNEAEADIKSQMAKLNELKQGTREEEIQIQQAKVLDAKQTLVDALQDAYTKSDDAIRNKADQFISNPRSNNPIVNLTINDSQLKSDFEKDRYAMELILMDWGALLNNLSVDSQFDQYVADTKNNLNIVKDFLVKASLVINSSNPSAQTSQTTLDGYRNNISTARANVNTAINNVSAAEANLTIQNRELSLQQAGTINEKIIFQEASVEQSQARADNIRAQINKTLIRSPINGVVTVQNAKMGEIAAANSTIISVISANKLEVDANIPEADIAKVKVGNEATATLDAYGSDLIFDLIVTSINPAESVIEGVSTYKTTLQFSKDDDRVRSGMTANVDITTNYKENVIAIPRRAVITKNGDKIVRLIKNDQVTETKVEVGVTGKDGLIEIISGVNEGDTVITFIE
ncbi:MAG: efflux RND transporter periplasmic adaptor subunit [bacterium]|nr:efflux RND transporter periplasmic adaptor subunit [bacterium]